MAREVRVVFLGDARDFSRAANQAQRDAADTNGAFGTVGRGAGAMGRAVAGGAAIGAVAVGAFAISAIRAGSDLQETVSKTNAVFGENSAAIHSWAEQAATDFGMSRQQALAAASDFGNMFVQLGIGAGEAGQMSQAMTELATDFASFHNADITEVITAQQAAFRGEYDALQRFVPTINAAAVAQRALEQTGKRTTAELTEQEKAIATQSLMLEGAGDAMGDFDRTSDSLANRQRILSARFEDVKSSLGEQLLPIAIRVAEFVATTLLPAFEGMIAKGREIVRAVQENWPAIQAAILPVIQNIQEVIVTALGYIQGAWQTFGDDIVRYARQGFENLMQIVRGAMEFIQGIINVVMAIVHGDFSQAWEGIKQVFHGAWNVISGVVQQLVNFMRLTISVGLEVVRGLFTNVWNGIVSFVGSIPGRIGAAARGMFDGIKTAFRAAINWIISAWNRLEFSIPGFDIDLPGPLGSIGWGGFTLGVPNIPTLHNGGIFQAPGGAREGLALLESGERVLPRGQSGEPVHVVVELDGRAIVDSLVRYNRANGPIRVQVA